MSVRGGLMVSQRIMQDVLEIACSTGGDFSELFFERQDETNIVLDNGNLDGIITKHLYGVGLYVLRGTQSVYVYTNQTTENALRVLAQKAAAFMQIALQSPSHFISKAHPSALREKTFFNPNRIEIEPSSISNKGKIHIASNAYLKMKSAGNALISARINYFDTDRHIIVANSQGLYTKDRRVTSRMRFGITTGDEKGSFYHWEDFTRMGGFEVFQKSDDYLEFAGKLVSRTENMRTAETMEPGVMPVILESGACGTLWHESCGHTLEATAIASRQSHFVDKIGQKVASDKVTLIDDGTLPNYYGTDAIDDEGHVRQKNTLIEKGILKSYMCDRLHGRMIGMASTGNGRRQNYTFAPVARMTNTYLAPGEDDEEAMIRSVADGLYVRSLGGGFGGTQFSLQVKEGYLIKKGKLDRQIKGTMITGNGAEVLMKVDSVGKSRGFEGGSFCGADSGLVPVTATQPMVRISEMSVG